MPCIQQVFIVRCKAAELVSGVIITDQSVTGSEPQGIGRIGFNVVDFRQGDAVLVANKVSDEFCISC